MRYDWVVCYNLNQIYGIPRSVKGPSKLYVEMESEQCVEYFIVEREILLGSDILPSYVKSE